MCTNVISKKTWHGRPARVISLLKLSFKGTGTGETPVPLLLLNGLTEWIARHLNDVVSLSQLLKLLVLGA